MALPDPRASAPESQASDGVDLRSGVEHIQQLLASAGRAADYRVVSLLGAGGLGVVYKAVDTRLQRAVAIKVIRGAHLLDSRATAKLRAEALSAASLDHPYICKMYELIDAGPEPLIVMEFLEGETLARVLRHGRPDRATTVRITLEIAEGLAAAHAQGLVHRDVTPRNVMITPHGHVKLLDFGLALADSMAASTDETRSNVQASDARAGTPRYMSPEQAAGGRVTARADLFSLGVVLFECLSGQLPFRGRDAYEYVHHLRTDAPARLDRLVPDLPDELVRLVEQCLEKSPSRRPESSAVVATLRQVLDSFSGVASGALPARPRRARLIGALVVALTAAVVALAWLASRGAPPVAPVWTSRLFAGASAAESSSRISPDGLWVSFISNTGPETELKVQRINGADAQRIQVPEGVVLSQLWSPDGSQIACVIRQGPATRLAIVPAFFGGVPSATVIVAKAPASVKLLRWIDRTVFLQVSDQTGRSLWRVDLEEGKPQPVSPAWQVAGTLHEFNVHPDGRRVVFAMAVSGQEDLWTANIDGSAAERLTNDVFVERDPVWAGRGQSVIYQSNRGGQLDLWETRIDGRLTGPLTSSPTAETPDDVSSDGRVVSFTQTAESAHLWLWSGAGARQLTDDALRDSSPSAGRSGARVVFQRTRPTGLGGNPVADSRLFVSALSSTGIWDDPRAIADGFAPLVSPDGLRVAYLQMASGPRATLVIRDLQTDQTTIVSKDARPSGYSVFPNDWTEPQMAWTPKGDALYFIERLDGWVIRRFQVETGVLDPPAVRAEEGQQFHGIGVSSDGRQLAFFVRAQGASVLRRLDIASGSFRDIRWRSSMLPILRGWLDSGSGVVVLQPRVIRDDFTADVDVLVATTTGEVRAAGRLERVFASTARLDPVREVVYGTGVESGVHNLYAMTLGRADWRRVTANSAPGVTFSGVAPLGHQRWLGVRTERTSDIWMVESAPQ